MKIVFIYIVSFIVVLFSACTKRIENDTIPDKFQLIIPAHFPQFNQPKYNLINKYKLELGKKLFYEKALSLDYSISCSYCHQPEFSFTSGGNQITPAIGGNSIPRNVPAIINAAYMNNYFWDGHSNSLEQMFYNDLLSPLIFKNDTIRIFQRLNQNEEYRKLFALAFNGDSTVNGTKIAFSIAAFVRSMISGSSRYDEYINGNKTALNKDEIAGMELFFSNRTLCSKCHTGLMFTDNQFHSTGINTHYFDKGRYYVTNINSDRGKFKTPTLRNIELTAPYMHNGEIATLEEIIDHYNYGGKPFINKSDSIKSLYLTDAEKNQLLAFLKSLTDKKFISKFGDK